MRFFKPSRLGCLLVAVPMTWAATAPCQEAQSTPEAAGAAEVLPFDERVYELSFQIFVGNRNLKDAYRVAAAAVRQRPDDPKWRQRLAQLAEWTQRPEEALAEWRDLARDSNNQEAWDAVRRLAPALYDYEALIAALERDARSRRLDDEEVKRLVQAYEAAGRPEAGIAFLQNLDRREPRREYLEQIAFLQQRIGRDADALASLDELSKRYGPQPVWALSAATLHILHADVEAAWSALNDARTGASPADTVYWSMLAELALSTQRTEEARSALLTLAEQDETNPDLLLRVMDLLVDRPEDAVRIAEEGWRKHRDPRFLLRALELHTQLRTFARGEALLATVDAEMLATLSTNVRFLLARAALRQGQGRLQPALADVEKALALAPAAPEVRLAWLWLLIDLRDDARLRALLSDIDETAVPSGPLADALAAAYVALEDFARALPLYSRRWNARRNDPVWLVNYSELLAEVGYGDKAYRVQQRALRLLREQASNAPRHAWPHAARLALAYSPGDPVARIVAELLQLEGDVHQIDSATAEVLLLWLMRSAQYDRAKLWLWRRYVHALAKPAWAEFAVALVQQDRPLLADMLANDYVRPRVDRQDRVEAAILLDEPFLARHYAFDEYEHHRDDPILYEQLVRLLPFTARIVGMSGAYSTRGVIEGPETRLFGRWPLTRTLSLDGGVLYARWDETDTDEIRNVPSTDVTLDARLTWRHLRLARSSVRAGWRDALENFPFAELAHEHPIGRVNSRLSLGTGLLADDGSAIRVAGRRDNLQLDLGWDASERTFLTAEFGASRYDTQDGEDLGIGVRAIGTVGHKLRLDYPDYTVRVSGGFYDYSREGVITGRAAQLVPGGQVATADFFLPEDFAIVGLFIGFGDDIRENYTRRWRPFMDVGVTYNTVSGVGFGVSGGIAGRVIGDDHLAISYNRIDGGSGLNETDEVFGLTYRYFY